MAEPQRNKDGIGEKPQWTTRQVIAFVATLASLAGFGGSKAFDYAVSSYDVEAERRPVVRDTSFAVIMERLSQIDGSIVVLKGEVSSLREDSRQNYTDLREDMRSMNKRLREYERSEYTMRDR